MPGYLHAPIGAAAGDATPLRSRRRRRWRAELGFDAAFVDEVPFVGGPGVRFDGQARFHPRKYLAGLARAIADRGGMIFEHSAADEFSDDPLVDHVERPHAHLRRRSCWRRTRR